MAFVFSFFDSALLALAVLCVVYYFWIKKNLFEENNIKFIKPQIFFGNVLQMSLGKEHLNHIVKNAYDTFMNEKYFGFFNFCMPVIVLRDLELIKQIGVKDFDHFTDHFIIVDENDSLFYNGLFALKGEKWHKMRSTLSPAFTASKMKEMMPFVLECSGKLDEYLIKNCNTSYAEKKEYFEIELKDTLSKCTNDVIASCAFGLQINSFEDPNNLFYKTSQNLTKIKLVEALKGLISTMLIPSARKFFNIRVMTEKTANFFRNIVRDIIETREKTGTNRRDMIHLLMMASQGSLKEETNSLEKENKQIGSNTLIKEFPDKNSTKGNWTEDELTAQAVIFLFAGFDTISTLLTFMCYELALHPEVQNRLRGEIDDYIKDNGNGITYNDIPNLKYMDMVVSETLRLWPPAGNFDRLCVKSLTLPPPNSYSKSYTIKKGDIVWIPIYSIHRDPNLYPNPTKFDPERFSEEKNASINIAYLPFGIGPRSCIGNRFALMEAKVVMFNLLKNFEIIRTHKTDVPVTVQAHPFNLAAKNGLWVGLKKRQTS